MIMDKDKKHPLPEDTDPIYDEENVASFTECTGVAPIGLMDGWQQNNVAALYAIHNRQKRQDEDNPLDDEDWPE